MLIEQGQQVFIKPEWQDEGDDLQTFVAVESVDLTDDFDSVVVAVASSTLYIKPHYRLQLRMIDSRTFNQE